MAGLADAHGNHEADGAVHCAGGYLHSHPNDAGHGQPVDVSGYQEPYVHCHYDDTSTDSTDGKGTAGGGGSVETFTVPVEQCALLERWQIIRLIQRYFKGEVARAYLLCAIERYWAWRAT